MVALALVLEGLVVPVELGVVPACLGFEGVAEGPVASVVLLERLEVRRVGDRL